jgi:uncharacterized protein YabN with tetrapyrrole methylase and pyrophosphatase domain
MFIENKLKQQNLKFDDVNLETLDIFWDEAKKLE